MATKKKYIANWSAGNTYGSFTGTNKNTIIRDVIEIVKGNFTGELAGWLIYEDGKAESIAGGWLDQQGRNHYSRK